VGSLLFLIAKLIVELFYNVKEAIAINFGYFVQKWADEKSCADEHDPRCWSIGFALIVVLVSAVGRF
jgi:hypothetical protein